ncbi:Ig-like domain-containing protein, partial [Salmonella enterica subsp. enterica serovar Typhimurium]|nr:Ig-like domain-containing protein [Salmonella enterica subsp. enterica serovar Typhimurium]
LPSAGTILAADAVPELAASFADYGSGVDVRTLEVELDGVAIASQVAASVSGFSFRPAQPLSEGLHTLVVRVADAAGNRA